MFRCFNPCSMQSCNLHADRVSNQFVSLISGFHHSIYCQSPKMRVTGFTDICDFGHRLRFRAGDTLMAWYIMPIAAFVFIQELKDLNRATHVRRAGLLLQVTRCTKERGLAH